MRIARILAVLMAASLSLGTPMLQAADSVQHVATSAEIPAPAPSAASTATGTQKTAAHPLTAEDLSAWLDGILPYGLKSGDIAGVEVSVVKDGQVLLQAGYGFADVDRKIKMDPERVMTRIGSTSKLFTWTAVMQLVQQGKLDLHRNIDDYLDFKVSPTGGPPITMLDLMNHRGGFEEGLKDVLATDPQAFMSTEAYLKQHPRPLIFQPGTVPAYSNAGASLAGYIVQRISGETFEHYVDQHIFQPLGMQHSTFEQPLPERFKGMASLGYRTASQPPVPYELVTTAPAGSVASTAADMTRFMLAHLQQGHLGTYDMLDAPTAQLMHSPSETSLPGFATMAHGFFHETRNGHLVLGHGGDTVVFHTEFDLLPQDGVGIFYSFNSRGSDQAVYGLRQAVLDQFMDRYFPKTDVSVEPATLASAGTDAQKIAGRYESSRRIEHGFLSLFYLFQQAVIEANSDGTINGPKAFESGEAHYREVAADVWREIGGTRQLALRNIGGLKTVLDSEDPTSVLQEVSVRKAAPLNLTVLGGSLIVLLVTVILWPISYFVRRHYEPAAVTSADAQRSRKVLRIAAALDLVWVIAWTAMLTPLVNLEMDLYSTAHDLRVRVLQMTGLIVIALAGAGIWSFWGLLRSGATWTSRIGHGLIAAALVGLVWIGFVGGLIGFDLNY